MKPYFQLFFSSMNGLLLLMVQTDEAKYGWLPTSLDANKAKLMWCFRVSLYVARIGVFQMALTIQTCIDFLKVYIEPYFKMKPNSSKKTMLYYIWRKEHLNKN